MLNLTVIFDSSSPWPPSLLRAHQEQAQQLALWTPPNTHAPLAWGPAPSIPELQVHLFPSPGSVPCTPSTVTSVFPAREALLVAVPHGTKFPSPPRLSRPFRVCLHRLVALSCCSLHLPTPGGRREPALLCRTRQAGSAAHAAVFTWTTPRLPSVYPDPALWFGLSV